MLKAPPEHTSLDGCHRKYKKGKAMSSKCLAENGLTEALEGEEPKVKGNWSGNPAGEEELCLIIIILVMVPLIT